MGTKRNSGGVGATGQTGQRTHGRAELICMTSAEAQVRITTQGATSAKGTDIGELNQLASAPDITMTPLFGTDLQRLLASALGGEVTTEIAERMSRCYHVEAPENRLEDLAEQLRQMHAVEAAYVKPQHELARIEMKQTEALNDMAPIDQEPATSTPDFTSRQGYLEVAPGGVDARYAWTQAGGRGAGVQVIDCEWGWRFTHEDLVGNQGGVIAGSSSTDTDHGTAVMGEIGGDLNAFGITGIAPDAVFSASTFSQPTATAIKAAADRARPGDIILLDPPLGAQRHRRRPAGIHRSRVVAGRLSGDPLRGDQGRGRGRGGRERG